LRTIARKADGTPRGEGIEANIGQGVLNALQSPQPPPADAVLISLINDITSFAGRIILVIDDYHLIEALPVHDAVTFLLEHLPPQMHLVIATREDPHLPLARLRARGLLIELRASDLKFSSSEAAELLNQVMGLDLSAEDIAALDQRTEGWVAGLQLAGLSMQGQTGTSSLIQAFTGSHRFVLDYLIEEVLEQQPESIQTFLVRTSILDRLTGSLCDAVRFGTAEAPSSSPRTAVRFGTAETPSTPLGSAVSGQGDGQAILGMLERANLFIVPLDQERRWYRYHHLFSDLLRQRLGQSEPDLNARLHHRASAWYEQHGFADEAIDHALRAKAFERAAHLIEEQVDVAWQSGEHAKLWLWLQALPPELLFSKPHLCVYRAWNLFSTGQPDAAERSLRAAEQALGIGTDLGAGPKSVQQGPTPDRDREKLQGRIAVSRASLAFFRGDVPGLLKHADQALAYLPEQDLAWRSIAAIALADAHRIRGDMKETYRARLEALEISKAAGNIYMILVASMKLAVTMRQQGQLAEVMEVCEQQLQLADECGLSQTAIAGGFLAIWGEVLAETDDMAGAVDRSERGVELARSGEDTVVLGWSYLCLMRVLLSAGDMAGAEALIQKVGNDTRESDVPPWILKMMAAWQARLWLAEGKLEAASQWLAERRLDVDKELQFLREFEQIVMARILMAQGRLDEAALLLQRQLEAAETVGYVSSAIEILILQALALQAQGEPEQAIDALEEALIRAEPSGFVRIFVDEGPSMSRLLDEACRRGMAADYVAQLLAAFEARRPPAGDGAQGDSVRPTRRVETWDRGGSQPSRAPRPAAGAGAPSPLVEPLSEREVEVLQLIAAGLSNREIATRLFLSLNTVKAHTRNIYGKLGVHSRIQAVARAQEVGLLPGRAM
jgi:LuxR family maltose regulon positive regulatory protein